MKELNDKSKEENRDFTPEEKEVWERTSDEHDSLDERIAREQELEARRQDELVEPDIDPTPSDPVKDRDTRKMQKDWIFSGKSAENRSLSYTHNDSPDMIEGRALQGDLDPSGGFLVPDQEFITSLIEAVRNRSFMRGLASVRPLGRAEALVLPRLGTRPEDSTWQGEINTVNEDTALDFDLITIAPHKSAKLERISMDLIDDSPMGVESIVTDQFGYVFGITEEQAFLTGNGAGQPLGVMVASALGISTARDYSTDNTNTTIEADNLIGQTTNLNAGYRENATWLFARPVIREIRQLKDGNGTYLLQPGLAFGTPGTILGFPFFESEYMPSTFTTGLYLGILGDFRRGYTIVDKMSFTMQRLVELYAATHQIGLIGRMRVGGAPVLEEAFTRVTLT